MPVRFRITLLFSLLALVILSLVCSGIYYFSYQERVNSLQGRLTNRAITTARLLSQREIFDRNMIERIDSATTLSLKNKVVQAYDSQNMLVYRYSDVANDILPVKPETISAARQEGSQFFQILGREAVAYHFTRSNADLIVVVAAKDVEGQEHLDDLLRILFFSLLLGTILILISGYFFSKGLLLPIKRISEDVAEISAQNLTRRIETGKSKDEWYQLSMTLNDLLNRLQESFDMQRRFISNASHELFTPLTAISSQLEVSLQRERGAEDYKRVMLSIYQDVQQLNKLTQTLLEFAKASGNSGGLEIDLVRVDELLLVMPAEVARMHTGYTVKIAFTEMPEDEESLLVFGNEALLLTAIKNIVVNACKFSQNHQALVSLKIAGSQIIVSVQDNGPGIAQEEIEKIFQPFYRAGDIRSAGGFGLGLALANRIIKIHKGSIEVDSTPGEGTTFFITLPSAKTLESIQMAGNTEI